MRRFDIFYRWVAVSYLTLVYIGIPSSAFTEWFRKSWWGGMNRIYKDKE